MKKPAKIEEQRHKKIPSAPREPNKQHQKTESKFLNATISNSARTLKKITTGT